MRYFAVILIAAAVLVTAAPASLQHEQPHPSGQPQPQPPSRQQQTDRPQRAHRLHEFRVSETDLGYLTTSDDDDDDSDQLSGDGELRGENRPSPSGFRVTSGAYTRSCVRAITSCFGGAPKNTRDKNSGAGSMPEFFARRHVLYERLRRPLPEDQPTPAIATVREREAKSTNSNLEELFPTAPLSTSQARPHRSTAGSTSLPPLNPFAHSPQAPPTIHLTREGGQLQWLEGDNRNYQQYASQSSPLPVGTTPSASRASESRARHRQQPSASRVHASSSLKVDEPPPPYAAALSPQSFSAASQTEDQQVHSYPPGLEPPNLRAEDEGKGKGKGKALEV